MRWHSGILNGRPVLDWDEILVLVHTPGVPRRWVVSVLGLGWRRKAQLRDMIDAVDKVRARELGEENAASVTPEDAQAMIMATPTSYRGPMPLYVTMWLNETPRSDTEIGRAIGVDRRKVGRWRRQNLIPEADF